MKAYPKYKDIGIDWLGEVPEHWDITNLKYVSDIIMGQSPSSNDYSEDDTDTPFLQGNAEFTESHPTPKVYCNTAVKIAPRGSLLFSVRAPVGALNRADQLYGIGRGLCAIKVNNTLINNYLWYLLHVTKTHAESLAVGSTYEAIPVHNVANMQILIPAIDEQQDIASYLSNATSRIDALIEKKEQMIELLKEKRIALITHAVTKGLDPNVKMKDSGIEWLGEVPEHWSIAKVGSGYSIQLGKMLQPEQNLESEIMIPYLKAINVQWDNIIVSEDNFMWGSMEEMVKYGIQKGDLLVCEGGEAGRSAILTEDIQGYIIQNALHRVRSTNNNVIYLKYLLQIASSLNWFDIICNKATIAHFTKDKFAEMVIPFPPKKEQQEIIASIEPKTVFIDTLIQKQEQMIELLTEYRSSLIHHAVTGKIDLRGYNAKTQ